MTRAAIPVALLCICVASSAAQTSAAPVRLHGSSVALDTISDSPLERRVAVHVRDVSLREALDRIALAASIRLSYSGENLPLDRRVSVSSDTSSLAEVLDQLLRGFAVQPMAVAADHVVLTPRPPMPGDTAARGVAVLDRVIVTGSVIEASERPLPVALDVVRGREVERRDVSDLSKLLDGSVPGVWMWEQSPSSMLARYGSIRGASSFGLSFPKVYIDGIEVANPLLLTQITPELVERVEVIRGPQGAALYGSDAISGVVNIVSRHEGTSAAGAHALLRSEGGYSVSNFAPGTVPTQEHSLTLRHGSNLRAGGFTLGAATSGEYVPQAYTRELRGVADFRSIGARSTFTAGARFFAKNAGVASSPLLASLNPEHSDADSQPQRLRLYSLGSTLTIVPNDYWTYSLTGGIDGYSLSNVTNELSPIPSVADTALRDASGAATRGTLRASAMKRTGAPERALSTVTFAAEQSLLWDNTLAELPGYGGGSDDVIQRHVAGLSGNTGLSSQVDLAWRNTAFLSGGLRFELIDPSRAAAQVATLPMLGGAWVRDFPGLTVKLRAAYGRGIRAPQSTLKVVTREPRRTIANPLLEPESQSGVEGGADVFLGRFLGLHVTRFDQRASGLIQTVTIGDTTTSNSGPGGGSLPRYWFQLQNVGVITNRGWEMQATSAVGPITLAGAATFVDSRVRQLARGYTGDLRPGDRMLAVPARTLSGSIGWSSRLFELSSTVARASDWVDYDRLAIAQAWLAAGGDGRTLTGSKLRTFWLNYPGATRLRAAGSWELSRNLRLHLTGENLLNFQRGEPDSITIVPGRTLTAGVRVKF